MAKIDKLTPEQEARFGEFRDKWIKIGLSCDPVDLETCRPFVDKAYQAGGLKPPKDLYLCDSPIHAARKYCELEGIKPTKSNMDTALSHQIYGSHEAGWLSFYDYMAQVVKVPGTELLDGLIGLAMNCGWWAPYEEAAILQHRHTQLHRDDQGRLHNEAGPAVAYRDNFAVYAIHNVRVTQQIVEHPESLTIQQIKGETNAEVRRIMRERYGDGRYLMDIGAKIEHTDSIASDKLAPRSTGSIMRALMIDDENNKWLVGSDGSTARVYHMRVPNRVKTCAEAHAAISGGMNTDRIVLEV